MAATRRLSSSTNGSSALPAIIFSARGRAASHQDQKAWIGAAGSAFARRLKITAGRLPAVSIV